MTSALAIGSGQSLGPGDPSLQMGAGLASAIGRRLELSRSRLRYIAPVGAAAGLAAAFNAPITAVLFVIEEVIGRWSAGVLGAVVLAAVSSVVTEQWFLGDEPLFRVPPYHLAHSSELLAYAVLGLVGGAVSLAFVKLVTGTAAAASRAAAVDVVLQPAVGRSHHRRHRAAVSAGDGRRLRVHRSGDARSVRLADARGAVRDQV